MRSDHFATSSISKAGEPQNAKSPVIPWRFKLRRSMYLFSFSLGPLKSLGGSEEDSDVEISN